MILTVRNALVIRLERILSMTNVIEVPWTRISSTKVHFQGSGQMLRNTLLRNLITRSDMTPIAGCAKAIFAGCDKGSVADFERFYIKSHKIDVGSHRG